MAKQVVAVFGATGQQGGSVARALLADSEFSVRGITRNTQSDKAQQLKSLGAELCQADLDKKDSVIRAVKGAKVVVLVTNILEHMDKQREIDQIILLCMDILQGTAALDACKSEGVQYIVFCGSGNCKKLCGIPVTFFDGKAVIEYRIKESGVPYANLRIADYHENFLSFWIRREKGWIFEVEVPMEDKPLDLMHIGGYGKCVRTIIKNPEIYKGQTIGLASDTLKVDEIVSAFNKHLTPEKQFINLNISPDAFAKLNTWGAEEMANMFRCYQTGKCERPDILNFDAWVEKNKEMIAVSLDKQLK